MRADALSLKKHICGRLVALLVFFMLLVMVHGPSDAQQRNRASQYHPPKPQRYPSDIDANFSVVALSSFNTPEEDQSVIAANISSKGHRSFTIAGPLLLNIYYNLNFGVSHRNDSIRENAWRVNDNDILGEAVLVLPLGWKIDPYIGANFRTAITESFLYRKGTRVRTAKFWDPVISQQTFGLAYAFNQNQQDVIGSARLGIGMQEARARYHTRQTDDRMTRHIVEAYNAQSGIEGVVNARVHMDSSILYTTRLFLFSSFDDLGVWNVEWENEMKFMIWKFLAFTWQFDIRHDITETRRTQFINNMMFGVAGNF